MINCLDINKQMDILRRQTKTLKEDNVRKAIAMGQDLLIMSIASDLPEALRGELENNVLLLKREIAYDKNDRNRGRFVIKNL